MKQYIVDAFTDQVFVGNPDAVCVMENEDQIVNAAPDLEKSKELDGLLLHITTKGTDYACVSRTFAQKLNVPEDSVCGSGHCHIAPLWSQKLGVTELVARRGGTLYCTINGDRICLAGKAVLYSVAELNV